jgi:hypothetical protein
MATNATVTFRSGVNSEKVHELTLKFLKNLGESSNNLNIEVSSAARSPYDQATVMYLNCEKLGMDSQYKLYGRNGDKVIRVYERMKKDRKKSSLEIIMAMHKQIMAIGPSKVSRHCADTSMMNVVDIPFSSISNKQAFREELRKNSPRPISKYLDETNNNCWHLELRIDDLKTHFKV